MKEKVMMLIEGYKASLETVIKEENKAKIKEQCSRLCAKIWAFYEIDILTFDEAEQIIGYFINRQVNSCY